MASKAPVFEENFPKFKPRSSEDSSLKTNEVKNSVQRAITASIAEAFPNVADAIKQILTGKLLIAKTKDTQIQMLVVDGEILFFQHQNGPFFPTLRLLHKFPSIMPRMQVDKGAIPFVLGGSNIMAPGFTSKGGSMPTPLEADQPVAIYAEGKEHALAVGMTRMSTDAITQVNKGVAVETYHYLMDGLWQSPNI